MLGSGKFERIVQRMSLRGHLVLLLCALVAVLAAEGLYEIAQQRDQEIRRSQERVRDLARRGAQRQADSIAESRVVLGMLSPVAGELPVDGAACDKHFYSITTEIAWLSSLFASDPDGNIICSSNFTRLAGGISDRAYFRKVTATQSFVISDFIIGRTTGQPGIIVGLPQFDSAGIRSFVFGRVDLYWLSRIAAAAVENRGAQVFVLDRNGTVIAAAPDPGDWIGKPSPLPVPDPASKEADGIFEAEIDGLGGQLVGYAKLEGTGATLLVALPRSSVLASINMSALQAIVRLAIITLLALLAAWLGGEHFLLQPLRRLIAGMEARRNGDEHAQVPEEGLSPEMRRLSAAFNSMSTSLTAREKELRDANARLTDLASRDGLTGLANRRRFDEKINEEWNRARRAGTPLSLVTLDVDHFKAFNDTYGHLAGDDCLRAIAIILEAHGRRPGDLAARIGGEEFALILPDTSAQHAASLAQAICDAIRKAGISHGGSEAGVVTVSVGVASAEPGPQGAVIDLLEAADRALYRGKQDGRDRVVSHDRTLRLAS